MGAAKTLASCNQPVALVCPQCGAEFTRPAWRVKQAGRSGTTMRCSQVCVHASRRYRTPEILAEYHRQYREKNRDWINEKQNAARFGPNREHILKRDRRLYRENIEAERRRAREYAAAHKEESQARQKAWPQQNPERAKFHSVRSSIYASTGIRPRDIPNELVEAHMEYLKVRRMVYDAVRKDAPED